MHVGREDDETTVMRVAWWRRSPVWLLLAGVVIAMAFGGGAAWVRTDQCQASITRMRDTSPTTERAAYIDAVIAHNRWCRWPWQPGRYYP
jgi:hypothetical protein